MTAVQPVAEAKAAFEITRRAVQVKEIHDDVKPAEAEVDTQDLTEHAAEIMEMNPQRATFVRTVMAAWDAGRLTTEQTAEYIYGPDHDK